jgi:hypothetical protein
MVNKDVQPMGTKSVAKSVQAVSSSENPYPAKMGWAAWTASVLMAPSMNVLGLMPFGVMETG